MWFLRHRYVLIVLLFLVAGIFLFQSASAQCSVCTRTAQQLGEKPARGLNAGIIYLAVLPLALMGFLGYKVWKNNQQ
jgi:UPF0716 family protein affecting phage T7 exclusion